MTDILRSDNNFILSFLKTPEIYLSYTKQDWSLLLRVARNTNILAHIGWILKHKGYFDHIPTKVKDNIDAAQRIVDYRKQTALWELNRLHHALNNLNTDIVILKGGAYLLSGLPFSQSRMFADVDILVPKDKIEIIEQTLLKQNWKSMKVDEYDQHYYREWMHEIPPLRHVVRTIEVDIHHTILPLTSRLKPSPGKLIADAASTKLYGFKTLSPCDMILHSATHLFYDSGLENKLKDLIDLGQLINHFSENNEHFTSELIERANELDLTKPLFYSLHFTQKLLGTKISAKDIQNAKYNTRISNVTLLIMNILVPPAILPEHPDHPKHRVRLARWFLYIRSHYLRMPLELLIPHLLHKSKVRWEARKTRP